MRFSKTARILVMAASILVLVGCASSQTEIGNPGVDSGKPLARAAMQPGLEVYAVAGTDISAVLGHILPDTPIASDTTLPPAAAYTTVGRWSKNPVTYSLENCPNHLDCAVAHDVLRQAVEAWDEVCGLTLDETTAGLGDIRITFGDDGLLAGGAPLDGPGGLLGYSYFPYSWLGPRAGDVYLDPDERWVTGTPTGDQVHLLTVAMHEVGHALGLDHTADSTALMWEEYEGPRALNADDIAGIQSLYGAPSGATAGGVQATATTAIRLRSGPGTTYQQVGTVPYNVTVPALGRNSVGDWLYVDYQGQRGWIAGWLANIQGDVLSLPVVGADGSGAAAPQPPSSPGDSAAQVVALETLRIRSGPGTEYRQIGRLPLRAVAPVIGRTSSNEWLLISYNGVQGWVAAWYCRVSGDLNQVPVAG